MFDKSVKLSEIETMKTNDRIINSWASKMLSNSYLKIGEESKPRL